MKSKIGGRAAQLPASGHEIPQHFTDSDYLVAHTSLDAEELLHLLQRQAFGFHDHRFYPDQLQQHHESKKSKNISGAFGMFVRADLLDHDWKRRRQQRCENPMRRTAQRLAFGAMAIGKNLRNENPDHRALTDGVRGDEGKNAWRHDAVMLREKSPGGKPERDDVAEGADEQQRASSKAINQPQPGEGE